MAMPRATISGAGSAPIGSPSKTICVGLVRQHAGNRAHQRRLAGAIGADDGDGLARLERHLDAEQRLEVAVARGESSGLEQRPSDFDPEIDLADLARAMISSGCADADHLAEIEHQQPLDDRVQRMQHVLDPDDRDAAPVDACELSRPANGIRASVRPPAISSSSSSSRFGRERPSELEPLALQQGRDRRPADWRDRPARSRRGYRAQRSATSRLALARAEAPQRPASSRTRSASRRAVGSGKCGRRPPGSAPWETRGSRRAPAKMTVPSSGGSVAGDQVEQRRLAGAVRPDDAERLALGQLEGHRVGDLQSAEALGDVFECRIGMSVITERQAPRAFPGCRGAIVLRAFSARRSAPSCRRSGCWARSCCR